MTAFAIDKSKNPTPPALMREPVATDPPTPPPWLQRIQRDEKSPSRVTHRRGNCVYTAVYDKTGARPTARPVALLLGCHRAFAKCREKLVLSFRTADKSCSLYIKAQKFTLRIASPLAARGYANASRSLIRREVDLTGAWANFRADKQRL